MLVLVDTRWLGVLFRKEKGQHGKRNDKYKTWLSIRGHVLTFELEVLKLDHYLLKVAY